MALASTTVFEVRTDGSDTNGGGFNPSRSANGVDRSQQASAHMFIDGATITATVHTTTTQLTISGYSVGNADLGNLLNITGGTATSGIYEVTAIDTVNNRWTLDRSAGTSTQTVIGRMGGAYASPGYLGAVLAANPISGMSSWFRSGNYTISVNNVNVAGGAISLPGSQNMYVSGYGSTRGDSGVATFTNVAATSIAIFNTPTNRWTHIKNIVVDGGGLTGVTGFAGGSRDEISFCRALNCPSFGFSGVTTPVSCEARSCGTGFSFFGNAYSCVARNCTGNGFNQLLFLYDCVAFANGGHGIDIADGGGANGAIKCISIGNTLRGFNSPASGLRFIDCVSTNNASYGYAGTAVYYNCYGFSNSLGNLLGTGLLGTSILNMTSSPWLDAAANDYRRNNTVNAGALLNGSAIGVPPGQMNARDSSAVQTSSTMARQVNIRGGADQ